MRVSVLTDGPESPGSRFRCLQFFPHLRARGIECEAHFAYDHRYNEVFERRWAPLYKLGGRLQRAARTILKGNGDLLLVHKTALAVSGLPEWLRSKLGTPIVFEFDDALHLGPNGADSTPRRRAFERLVEVADQVIAGNTYLAEVAGAPEKTTVIPSVIDTDIYLPAAAKREGSLVVGWIGTASNFSHLRPIVPGLLQELTTIPRARLRIVSNGFLSEFANHPQVEHWRWRADRELAALQSFDIGIMPLEDNEQSRGKCGFKMIQYMACGVPVLASAVGANVQILERSGAGHLVGGDWGTPVRDLASSAELRASMGHRGRLHAEENYSVRSVLDRYVEVFSAAHGARA